MSTLSHDAYEFGPFRLEVAERRLSRDGTVVPLTPKVFDTLVLLVERSGHLVTKSELMASLWGDMVVEEANLTKNVWLLRKALAEDPDAPCIETVPKVGYRWLSPVRRVEPSPVPAAVAVPAAPAAASAPAPVAALIAAPVSPSHVPPAPVEPGFAGDLPRTRAGAPVRTRTVAILGGLLVAGIAGLVLFFTLRSRPNVSRSAATARIPARSAPPRPVVAVLGFSDLSGRGSTAWLSTALSEMVASELAAGERVRLVAAEDVVRQNVSAPAGTLSAETLDRLRRVLHADFVVRGAYAVVPSGPVSGAAGAAGVDQLRLDVVVQDARTGESAGAVSATGAENDLFQLVSSVGTELRGKLGLSAATSAEQASIAVSLPKNPEASRLYAEGLDRLRRLDAQAARGLLERAASLEPSHPLIHDALSRAWSALGYDEKSRQEAERAEALSAGLSREDRLAIEAHFWEARMEWDRAIEVERTLFGFFPDRLDYGLKLAGAQTAGGKAKDALVTIAKLSRLSAPDRDDPRIDLEEARAAAALSDNPRRLAAATRAADKASAAESHGLAARAKSEQANALEDLGRSTSAASVSRREEIIRLFEADGDVNGAATARIGLGNTAMRGGDLSGAAALYGQARDAFRRVGNQAGLATAYADLCLVEWLQGRVDEARAHARQVIDIRRETHDRSGTAWGLTVLGNLMVEEGRFDEAYKLQNEALDISREIGDRSYAAFCLEALGSAYQAQGDLSHAEKNFRDSLAIAEQLKEPEAVALRLDDLANLAMDRGEVDAAERGYLQALELRVKNEDEGGAAETRMELAQLRQDQGRFPEAASLAADAAKVFEKQNQPGNLAISRATLARADAAMGRRDEARKELASARELVSSSRQNGAVIPVLLVAARLDRVMGDLAGARSLASEARKRAERVRWRGYILEARLVEAEIDLGPRAQPPALAALSALAREARVSGFGRIAREAEATIAKGFRRAVP